MEPGVERARTQQHCLEMPLEFLAALGLMLRLLVFSSLIWRLVLTDKSVFAEWLLLDLNVYSSAILHVSYIRSVF